MFSLECASVTLEDMATAIDAARSSAAMTALTTVVVGQVADVSCTRGGDPGFYRRVRLFARLDALEEILHMCDGAVAEAVFGQNRILRRSGRPRDKRRSRCGRSSRSLPFRGTPGRHHRWRNSSCPRTPHQTRDSGRPPEWCRDNPTGRKHICPPSICASRGWSDFMAQCTTSIQW